MEQGERTVDEFGRPWPPKFKVVSDRHAARVRAMSLEERFRAADELYRLVRDRYVLQIVAEHPEWTETEVMPEFHSRARADEDAHGPVYISDVWEEQERCAGLV